MEALWTIGKTWSCILLILGTIGVMTSDCYVERRLMKTQPGKLIVVEGIDGSGKSTVASALYQRLAEHYEVVATREPGGSSLGIHIRSIVHQQVDALDPKAEFLLFAADRAEHIRHIIRPALQAGKIIISDRMADSSVAYQGFGRGVEIDMIKEINSWVMDEVQPDLILYIRVDVATAQARIEQRGETKTSFDKESRDFFQRVTDGFDTLFCNCSCTVTIDGSQSPEQVLEDAWYQCQKVLADE